jgi:integrase
VITFHLLPALGPIPLARLGPAAIEDPIARERKRGSAEASIARQIAVLSSALNRAVKRGLIRQNPVKMIDRPKIPPSATEYLDTEAAPLFQAALVKSPLAAVIAFILETGCRSSEARAVREVDIDAGAVHFRQKVRRHRGRWIFEDTLKTRTSRRTVTLTPELLGLLGPLMRGDGGLLFRNLDGSPQRSRARAAASARPREHPDDI